MFSEIAKEVAKLPATLFSPARMVYIAYVIFTCLRVSKDPNSWSLATFIWISVVFVLVEVLHNDWARIRLNNHAEKNRPEWLRPR
jgi:hypothetical protein